MEAKKIMKITHALALVCAALLGAPGVTSAADEGAKIYATVCSECHSAKKNPLDKLHLTRAEWSEALDRMLSYGAEVPKDKMPELLDYLLKSHGPGGAGGEGK